MWYGYALILSLLTLVYVVKLVNNSLFEIAHSDPSAGESRAYEFKRNSPDNASIVELTQSRPRLSNESTYTTSSPQNSSTSQSNVSDSTTDVNRHELFPNCSPPAINQFPVDVFTFSQRRHGAMILHVLLSLYMFAGLAVVCDEYFISSLERISERLHLQSDVAGATFMAAGSSAPELFTSVIGVFITKDDVGIGTIVGSAVFNLLCILALCGLLAGMVIELSWWPLLRDTTYYLISIIALATVMADEIVHWYEAASLLVLYIIYIVVMYFNERLSNIAMEKVRLWKHKYHKVSVEEKSPLVAESFHRTSKGTENKNHEEIEMENTTMKGVIKPYCTEGNHSEESVPLTNGNGSFVNTEKDNPEETMQDSTNKAPVDETMESSSPFRLPEGFTKKMLWVFSLPVYGLLFVTVPDCRTQRWKSWYLLTFIISILWITVFSYVLVWMITLIGYTLNIPDAVMGLTVLAAGTSVPDALASLLVAKDGYGNMAVSNSIGSNIFDVLLCLGLPWFLKAAFMSSDTGIYIYGRGLTYTTLMLIATVTILLISIVLNKWQLDKKLGVIFFVIYCLFMSFAVMYELNVFGPFNLPTCPL
ncbi:sodium/potassium/calcium exchanger 5-like isoform X2 [Ptychodera flava]